MRSFLRANQAIAGPGLAFIAPRTALGLAARDAPLKTGPVLSFLSRFDTKLAKASEAIRLDAR
jgi:hypothetical protein